MSKILFNKTFKIVGGEEGLIKCIVFLHFIFLKLAVKFKKYSIQIVEYCGIYFDISTNFQIEKKNSYWRFIMK